MSRPHTELTRALAIAAAIPGLYLPREAAWLYQLARVPGDIVEIGAWQGHTTAIMAQAARAAGANMVSIDPFAPMPEGHIQSSVELWTANLTGAGLVPPLLIPLPSHQAVGMVQDYLALVFIDGDHVAEAVALDLAEWGPKVHVGGVLALHDMFYPNIPGVALAVCAWWTGGAYKKWECIGLIDYTIAFKRTHE